MVVDLADIGQDEANIIISHDQKKEYLIPVLQFCTNPEKKLVDQSLLTPSGIPTENGKFFQAALDYKHGVKEPSQIQVYRKLRKGIFLLTI